MILDYHWLIQLHDVPQNVLLQLKVIPKFSLVDTWSYDIQKIDTSEF